MQLSYAGVQFERLKYQNMEFSIENIPKVATLICFA